MGMQAGKLRHKIKIQVGTITQNATGEEILTWTDLAVRWASVEPLTGKEAFQEDHLQAEVTHKIFVRKTAGVVPKMRVLFGSRVFDIKSVLNIEERGVMLKLMCEEKV